MEPAHAVFSRNGERNCAVDTAASYHTRDSCQRRRKRIDSSSSRQKERTAARRRRMPVSVSALSLSALSTRDTRAVLAATMVSAAASRAGSACRSRCRVAVRLFEHRKRGRSTLSRGAHRQTRTSRAPEPFTIRCLNRAFRWPSRVRSTRRCRARSRDLPRPSRAECSRSIAMARADAGFCHSENAYAALSSWLFLF